MIDPHSAAIARRSLFGSRWTTAMVLTFTALMGPAVASGEQGLTEAECVRAGLQFHPAIALARSRRVEAAGRVVQALSPTRPQAGLSFSYLVYDWLPPNKEKILGGGNTDIYSEIIVSQLITSFGRVEGVAEAARVRLAAESASLRRTEQTVAYNARAAYHALRYARTAVAYYVEAEQQMKHHLEIARSLVQHRPTAPESAESGGKRSAGAQRGDGTQRESAGRPCSHRS